MSAILGIDVSKATFDCVLLQNEQSAYQQFENHPQGFELLRLWLASHNVEQVHATIEATGRYADALALDLHCAGFTVSLINPRYIKAFGQSLGKYHKTDKQDAYLIALFCQRHCPEPWTPTSPLLERLKQETRYLQSLKTMRQQERNRLQSGLTDPFLKQQLDAHIAFLDAQIDDLQKQIKQTIFADDKLKLDYSLLLSIPAIGDTSAPIILAEMGDINHFDSANALAAYAGLTPRHFQSGSSVHRPTHISKQGNSHLRTALYMPALGAPRWNTRCQDLEQRLQTQAKSGKVIIIANMHLLLRIVYGVLKHQQPYDPHYLQSQAFAA
jgi:transposase